MQQVTTESRDLVDVDEKGKAHVKFHGGQRRAWNSQARFVFVFSGFQGGKTSFIPWWLNREIDRTEQPKGENDYIAVTASFDLFKLKFLPEMRRVFELHPARGERIVGCLNVGHFVVEDRARMIELRLLRRGEHQPNPPAIEKG